MGVGQYQLKTLLGSGGMGQVWRAIDPALEREVAIKVLLETTASDPEFRARFLREARLAARLNHPNIATIFAVEEQESTLYLVMELVEGASLDRLIAKGPLAEASAVDIALQVAAAIGEAHSQGIIHRDIKPENIMLSARGVKVLDFGIAREMASPANVTVTQAGIVLGTPHYMSPEQAQGFPLNGGSDIFSLGAVLYEMLSGTKPFLGETAMAILLQVATYRHAPLQNVAPELAAIVDRCLEKKPAKRFQTANELVDALSQWARRSAPAPTASTTPTVMLESAGATPPATARRVLVADDDLVARQVLRNALERLGYEVDEAVDGSDAIRRLKSELYAVLITDLLMPRLDGWAVLDFLRYFPARRPGRILVSSTMSDIKLSEADRQLVNAVVSKPVTMAQLSQGLTAMSSV